ERLRDTRMLLETGAECWVASASGGLPHLVPLSFGWHHGVITLATPARYRTAQNLASNPGVKLAFGTLSDVVIVEGVAVVCDIDDVAAAALDHFTVQGGWDPRRAEGHAIIEVTPRRVLAWCRENELKGRLLMRDGRWLDEDGAEGSP
ncbi:MAG: pyridoxamine 5'-phosphate oxidase family protein, partial [Acidimicrobiia bacterium]|nr:pyridoxamine 5'-phosphate oxidase family protein [Acidimicrobiia bacterium]